MTAFSSFRSQWLLVLPLLIMAFLLSGCDSLENLSRTDREGNLEKQDYRDALAARDNFENDEAGASAGGSGVPELRPYVAHNYKAQRHYPLVSVSVNRSVPIRDVFYQLAEQAEVDLELDPSIRGSMIFTARQRPFDQVIERICDLAGLRYQLQDNVLRVERDTPYNEVYKLDYLSFIRSNSSSIETSVSVVSGDEADTGSSFSSRFESSSDFWADLEDNVKKLLSNSKRYALTTREDPEMTVVEPSGPGASDAVISIGAIDMPDDEEDLDEDDAESRYVINRQAGLISVYATQAKHKEVKQFLDDLRRSLTAQVLIEAKVLEIELNDEFSSGVDWSFLDTGIADLTLDYLSSSGLAALGTAEFSRFPDGANSGVITPASSFVGTYKGNDVQALVRAVSEYGTTKALASPRLVVLNNQSAVLNVARNRVFFIVTDTETEIDEDTGDRVQSFSYDTRTVPEGVIINVMPSINLDKGTVALAVRPSVTDIGSDTIRNPFVDTDTFIPQVSIQEVDTVLNVRSGEAVVIGGLMRDTAAATEDGVPGLSDISLLGSLFRSHNDQIRKTELVIFLRATILNKASDSIHDTDRDLYRKFSGDRRPFKM